MVVMGDDKSLSAAWAQPSSPGRRQCCVQLPRKQIE